MLAFARQGDTVVVHSMDRLAPAERASLLAFPTTYDELIRHYTFSEFDLASIQQGTVKASLMLRKLGSYPRHSSLALALRELEVATSFRCSAMDYLLLRTSMSSSDTFREVRFIVLPPRLLKFVFTDLRLTWKSCCAIFSSPSPDNPLLHSVFGKVKTTVLPLAARIPRRSPMACIEPVFRL